MSARTIRCPNCGGDVDLDAKECPYCNSDIVYNEYDDKKKIVKDILIAARNDISEGRFTGCRSHIDDILSIDPKCADAWYMSAALYSTDDVKFESEKKRAAACTSDYGIFGVSDLDVYRKKARKEKKKGVTMTFLCIGFVVLFLGGVLSLGLGLGLGTLIPLFVTLALIAILLVVYVLIIIAMGRKD